MKEQILNNVEISKQARLSSNFLVHCKKSILSPNFATRLFSELYQAGLDYLDGAEDIAQWNAPGECMKSVNDRHDREVHEIYERHDITRDRAIVLWDFLVTNNRSNHDLASIMFM